jgi:hypothetical protein
MQYATLLGSRSARRTRDSEDLFAREFSLLHLEKMRRSPPASLFNIALPLTNRGLLYSERAGFHFSDNMTNEKQSAM